MTSRCSAPHTVRRTLALFGLLLAAAFGSAANSADLLVDRSGYADRLRGFWLGSSIGNWTGLATENIRSAPPFFTDRDWQTTVGREGQIVDYVLDSAPWGADDDTDIEYVYQKAMQQNDGRTLSAEQIAAAWQTHIGLPLLWVSNLAALGQMQNGALPPATSLPQNNPMWDMIDAQLTTEIFGALAPGRPDVALKIAHLPIRTTAYLHSEWAAEFYVIMHALVPLADPHLSLAEQVMWLAREARKRIPDWSYIADMYDFVLADYLANADKDNWERSRDALYARYQLAGTAGYRYKYPWDSGINFASSLVSLFYGAGDFRKTLRIGTLAGWDSDNPTATWGGLLGLLYGHKELQRYFAKGDFSDDYLISRTRYNFPTEPDTFTAMAAAGIAIIDTLVREEAGGVIRDAHWVIPPMQGDIPTAAARETTIPWQTIEDSDPRWRYDGFTTEGERWNASGATLTTGQADCLAEMHFSGTAVQYFAFRDAASGTVTVTLDGREEAPVDLANRISGKPQYYAKVYERLGLAPGEHVLTIRCDSQTSGKSIDMLQIIP